MPNSRDDSAVTEARSSSALLSSLSAMMFLQYWPLGVWGVTVGTFIAANTGNEGDAIFSAGFVGYSTAAGAIGSMLSPALIGYLSDRYFSAERLLAGMQIGCAATAWGLHESRTETAFFLWLVGYFQFFVPATTLTNKIALRHLANVEREYAFVRVFATAGWITAGLAVGFAWPLATGASIEATRTPLALGAAGSLLMAAFSITLPHTPPERDGESRSGDGPSRADALLTNRPLRLFLLISMLACVSSMAYNNYANLFLNHQRYPHPAALMTLGQISDVLCLIATPWFISRIGLKGLFFTGTLAWAVRYALLAAGSYWQLEWPVYAAILIHGPCFVFVYVVGVMYVDQLAGPAHRGAAQGLLALASTGLGHLLGALSVGFTQSLFLTPAGVTPPPYHWPAFWLVPAATSLVAAALFKMSFASAPADRSVKAPQNLN